MEIVIPGAANLGLFTVAALALLVVPGPAVLYIVAEWMPRSETKPASRPCSTERATM